MSYDTLTEIEWEQVDRVWRMIEEDEIENARREVDALGKLRPGHPDLRIVDAAVALEEGKAQRALEALNGAERSFDPALFFHLRAAAHYELVHLEQARDDAGRALDVRAEMAETHDLLGRILEHLGDPEKSSDHAAAAHALDPENYPEPLEVSDEDFDRLVEKSLTELPEPVRKHLQNLPVVVESLPSRALLISEQPKLSPDILGLFVGSGLLERTHSDLPSAPGAIYLFRRNLLRFCTDEEELAREVRTTVQHEVGHLLGLDEDDLEEWGLA